MQSKIFRAGIHPSKWTAGNEDMLGGGLCSSSGLVDHSARCPGLDRIHPGAVGLVKLKTMLHPGLDEMVSEGMSRCWLFPGGREQSVRTGLLLLGRCVVQKRLCLKCIRHMTIKVHISEDLYPCPSSGLGEEDKLHSNARTRSGPQLGTVYIHGTDAPRG